VSEGRNVSKRGSKVDGLTIVPYKVKSPTLPSGNGYQSQLHVAPRNPQAGHKPGRSRTNDRSRRGNDNRNNNKPVISEHR
jgi:hypothetical protein